MHLLARVCVEPVFILLALFNLDFKLFSKSRLVYDSRRDEMQPSTT